MKDLLNADYQVDAFVDQLDRNGNLIKSYTFRGMFPITLDDIGLDYILTMQ